ncbi:hypothetical protein A0H81_10310 [Grifola frondosa]|uniref:Eukaryotic translation initiation factor 4G1 eIF4E-binding domain-containing protein n=1 Tax=Grifola frondosa TaxID=5627 RepID=A0A1C7M428_GRIFR|nr:hypothetical protein A0H81_10310 [Grifola frondosa]
MDCVFPSTTSCVPELQEPFWLRTRTSSMMLRLYPRHRTLRSRIHEARRPRDNLKPTTRSLAPIGDERSHSDTLPYALTGVQTIEDLGLYHVSRGYQDPNAELNIHPDSGKFRYDREFLLQFMAICKEKPDFLPPLDVIGITPTDEPFIVRSGGPGPRMPSASTSSIASTVAPFNMMGQFSNNELSHEERFQMSTRPASIMSKPFTATKSDDSFRPHKNLPRLSTPCEGVSFKDGIAGAHGPPPYMKSGLPVTFGSIDDISAPGPSSPVNVRPIRSENIKQFAPLRDVKKLFQSPNIIPSTTTTTAPSNMTSSSNLPASLPSLAAQPIAIPRPVPISEYPGYYYPPYPGMPVSPRTQLPQHHPTGMPPLPPAVPVTGHPPHMIPSPHTASMSSISSPPPRLPRRLHREDPSGREIDLEQFKKPGCVGSVPPNSPARKMVVRMETPEAKAKRLAEQNGEEWLKKEAEKAVRRTEKKKRKEERRKMVEEERAPAHPEAIKRRLGPLDISGTTGAIPPLPSALATTRAIKNLGSIVYPEGIKGPNAELNVNAKQGEFRYDREFLLQFMDVCKEKPDSLFPLDVIGLRPAAILRSAGKLEASEPTIAAMPASKKDAYQPSMNESAGSRRGGEYVQTGPDKWSTSGSSISRPPKAGDLSNFGKIKAKPEPRDFVNATSLSSQDPELMPLRKSESILHSGSIPATRPSSLFHHRGYAQSRDDGPRTRSPSSDEDTITKPEVVLSDAEVYSTVCQNSHEFFTARDLHAGAMYFARLPEVHRWRLVDKLVSSAIESTESDSLLVAGLFDCISSKGLCPSASFEKGFSPVAQALDYIAMDTPQAYNRMAMMMKGAHIHEDDERCKRLASKSRDSDMLLSLLIP